MSKPSSRVTITMRRLPSSMRRTLPLRSKSTSPWAPAPTPAPPMSSPTAFRAHSRRGKIIMEALEPMGSPSAEAIAARLIMKGNRVDRRRRAHMLLGDRKYRKDPALDKTRSLRYDEN